MKKPFCSLSLILATTFLAYADPTPRPRPTPAPRPQANCAQLVKDLAPLLNSTDPQMVEFAKAIEVMEGCGSANGGFRAHTPAPDYPHQY